MQKSLEYRQIYEANLDDYIFIDVRSPKEYEEATIPGAINIPLFTDEERAIIGTIYVNNSVEKAKILGVEYISRKLPNIFSKIIELNKIHKNLMFFCARGGMRSSSLTSLLSTLGINAIKLKGGYKGYRQYINEELPKENLLVKYIVLHGNTGVGKTCILERLQNLGYDILDLEQCANNRGSLLGAVGLGEARSQKQFEALVYNSLKGRKSDYIFVEGESKRIGNIIIPDYIFNSMDNGIHIHVKGGIEFRSTLLVNEYTKKHGFEKEILKAFENLKKYIGEKNREKYIHMLEQRQFKELAEELMVKYYDPMYENENKKYIYNYEIKVNNIDNAAVSIRNWFENYIQ